MYSLTVVIGAAITGGITVGGVVWLVMIIGQLRDRVAELEKAKTAPVPATTQAWAHNLQNEHRAQLLSVAALVKLSARDNLDALMRLSPEMVKALLREEFPHLFDQEVR